MLKERRNPVGVKAELNNHVRLDEKRQSVAQLTKNKKQIQTEKSFRTYCWQKETKKKRIKRFLTAKKTVNRLQAKRREIVT